jgi:predicted metalloprotease with PDZ domain
MTLAPTRRSHVRLAVLLASVVATAAHGPFHVSNVARIRPSIVEPFDLQTANTSGELWLAEGVTTYYEKLVMHRAGLSTATVDR